MLEDGQKFRILKVINVEKSCRSNNDIHGDEGGARVMNKMTLRNGKLRASGNFKCGTASCINIEI